MSDLSRRRKAAGKVETRVDQVGIRGLGTG